MSATKIDTTRCADCGAPGDFTEYGGVCWGCVMASGTREEFGLRTIRDVMNKSDDEILAIGKTMGLPMDQYSPIGHRLILLTTLRITEDG